MTVAVLAFHAIQDGPAPLCIPVERFARIVDDVRRSGAVALTLGAAADALAGRAPMPRRGVVFTFDDAYASVHLHAWPVLAAVGWPATVFQVAGAVGGVNHWDPPGSAAGGRRLLDAAQLRDLRRAGWEIGGHTWSHRSLPGLAPATVAEELDAADEHLASLLGERPSVFAYPYGAHDATTRAAARDRYRACVTVGASLASPGCPPDAIPRVEGWYLRPPGVARHLFDAAGRAYLSARRVARAVR